MSDAANVRAHLWASHNINHARLNPVEVVLVHQQIHAGVASRFFPVPDHTHDGSGLVRMLDPIEVDEAKVWREIEEWERKHVG